MFFVDVKFCFLKIPIVPLALLNKSFFHFPRIEFWAYTGCAFGTIW